MAINSSDITYSLIPEVTLGVTPTSGNRYELPVKSGQAVPTYNGNEIISDTMRPNRAGNGSRRGIQSGEGTLGFNFQACDAIDYLISSALSSNWVTVPGVDNNPDVTSIKAGKTDKSFTTVAGFKSDWFQYSAGALCSGMTITAQTGELVSAEFAFMFINREDNATDSSITLTASNGGYEFDGRDVRNIVITSYDENGNPTNTTNINYTELTFELGQERAAQVKLGSNTPMGVGTGGNRQTQVTIKFFKEDRIREAIFDGSKQTISFDVGINGDGYRFELPIAQASVPEDQTENELMSSVVYTAAYSDADQTDVIVTKL